MPTGTVKWFNPTKAMVLLSLAMVQRMPSFIFLQFSKLGCKH